MYHVDNKTGVSTMPEIPPSESEVPQWFTEGGPGEEPTIPGSTTWNIWQAELLNILAAAEVKPDKFKLNQIAESIGIMIANGIENAELLPGISYKPRTDSLNNQQGQIVSIKNKDMNTCVAGEFGLYEKATCAHSPPGAGPYFYCETKSIYSAEALIQIAWAYDGSGVLAWRNYSQNTHEWDVVWREAYDTKNPPTASDIEGLDEALGEKVDRAGDIMVGPLTISAGANLLVLDCASGTYGLIRGKRNGGDKWFIGLNGTSTDEVAWNSYAGDVRITLLPAGFAECSRLFKARGFETTATQGTAGNALTRRDFLEEQIATRAPESHTHTPASIGAAYTMRPFTNGGAITGFTQCTVSLARGGRLYPLTFAIPSATTSFWIVNRGGENADRDYDFGVTCTRSGSNMTLTAVGNGPTLSTIYVM